MQETEIDVRGEFERLAEAFEAFESLRTEGEAACKARNQGVSGWSVEQHLFHIALATDLAFQHVRALAAGKGRLIQEEGALDPRAASVLNSDKTPRGEAQAPRMVTPDADVDPEFLATELRMNREALEGLRSLEDAITAASGWIPHQVLGPLAAPHWLRFAALHARHHWAIIRDIRSAR